MLMCWFFMNLLCCFYLFGLFFFCSYVFFFFFFFFFSSRRRHTRFDCDWSSDVCSSDLIDKFDCAHEWQPRPFVAKQNDKAVTAWRQVCVDWRFFLVWPSRNLREIGRASCRERV